MECAEEITTLRAALSPLTGIEQVDFNLIERRMTVRYIAEQIRPEEVARAVQRTGMQAAPFDEAADQAEDRSLWRRWGRTRMTALSGAHPAAAYFSHVVAVGWRPAIGEHEPSAIPLAVRWLHVLAAIAGGWFVLRPDASAVVQALRATGIEHVITLTGDNRPTAKAIARASGIDEFRADLRPEDKVTAVGELVRRYGTIGMIGDGVNDAPALARASIGIAMGAIGTDAAIEAADIALMSDNLSRVPRLIRHSRRALRIVRQNIVASLAIKAAFVVLTLYGYAPLWAAIAADMGVSRLAVGHALRLLRDRVGSKFHA
jgi:cation transport ATPase